MNEMKNAVLEIERGGGELIAFVAEDPNLSYTINSNEEQYEIGFTFHTRNIDPVVAFIARKTENKVSMSKVIITENNEIEIKPMPFGLAHWFYFKNNNEKMINNGTYFAQRITE